MWCSDMTIGEFNRRVTSATGFRSVWGVVEPKEAMEEGGGWVGRVKKIEGTEEAVRRVAEWWIEKETADSSSSSSFSSSSSAPSLGENVHPQLSRRRIAGVKLDEYFDLYCLVISSSLSDDGAGFFTLLLTVWDGTKSPST